MNTEPEKHYSPEQWSDFVRNVADSKSSRRMREHLDRGCASCAKMVQWIETVMRTAKDIAVEQDPPPELVANAKSLFRPRRDPPIPGMGTLETLVAELVLVSSGDWLPAGVRSGGVAGERLLYRAGEYSIELTFDPPDSYDGTGEIVGQITETASIEPAGMGGILVQVCVGDRLLGESETNEFGEFVTPRPSSPAAVLRFALTGTSKRIEVRLRGGKERTAQ